MRSAEARDNYEMHTQAPQIGLPEKKRGCAAMREIAYQDIVTEVADL